jgi:putative endonuclease
MTGHDSCCQFPSSCTTKRNHQGAMSAAWYAQSLESFRRGMTTICCVALDLEVGTRETSVGLPIRWAYNAPVSTIYCYILECSDGTLYTGCTSDPVRRLREHNAGRGGRYTRSRRPLFLRYLEPQPSRRIAMQRERALKALPRQQKLALIDEHQESLEVSAFDRENDVQNKQNTVDHG